MALVSWNGAKPRDGTHSLSPTFICRPCQLQAPVFTFQSPLFPPSAGAAAGLGWAGLGGRTQAGRWRLWVGTQLESLKFKIMTLAQRGKGFASHPGSQWQGQSPALCLPPSVEFSKPQVLFLTEGICVFASSSGSVWHGGLGSMPGLVRAQRPSSGACPTTGGACLEGGTLRSHPPVPDVVGAQADP